MRIHNIFSRYVFLPVGKTCSGRRYFKALKYQRYLEETQYWDDVRIDNLRNRLFQELISHCFHNVPFYRDYMIRNNLRIEDFKTYRDIIKFPLLTKKVINENFNDLLAQNYKKRKIRYDATGGTTGVPVNFARDKKNEYRVDANNWRLWNFAGSKPWMKSALFWGNELELSKSNTVKQKLKSMMENTKILNFFDLSEKRLRQYTEYIVKNKPEIIHGYASSVFLYVKYCKEHQIPFAYRPQSVILTADKISKYQKEKISDFFQCEVFEEYGCREFSIIAHECSHHQGFHLSEELFIFEVFDLNSKKCSFEGKGEIVVTPFFNYAMPLLRYCLGDEVTISSEICSCGRKLKLLSNVEGRIADYVITKSGKLIHGEFFAHLFYFCKGVEMYQINQHEKGIVVINIVKNKNFQESEVVKFLADLKKMCKDDLEASVEYVANIKTPASGKRRSVISNIISDYINGRESYYKR
jgi:phenylacetate-CoA ligase